MDVIYEVNLRVDPEVARDYAAWLKPHMEAMLALEGFESAQWWQEEPAMGDGRDGWVLWTIHYHLRSHQDLEAYLQEGAAAMRQDGLARFKGRFEATRRVLTRRA